MKIINVDFPVKILIFDNYPFHQELKDEISDVLENYPDIQNKSTNVKATMTEWMINSPQIEKLKEYIIHVFRENVVDADMYIKNFWGNIYRKGEYTRFHGHLPEDFAFVYFLKSKQDYSPLVIKKSSNSWKKIKIKPKEGRLVIHPSFIVHGVPKHKHNETRITLAGDLNYLRK